MDPTVLLPIAALLVVLVLRRHRRRTAGRAGVDDVDAELAAEVETDAERVDVGTLTASDGTSGEGPERTPREAPERAAALAEPTLRRQVTATIRGLGERTREDETPERTLARVAAALERLEVPESLTRPVLPTVPFGVAGPPVTLVAPRPVPALGQAPEVTVEHVVPAVEPDVEPAVEPAAQTAVRPPVGQDVRPARGETDEESPEESPAARSAESTLPAPPEPDVVLPVPPPTPLRPQRVRRWGRGARAERTPS